MSWLFGKSPGHYVQQLKQQIEDVSVEGGEDEKKMTAMTKTMAKLKGYLFNSNARQAAQLKLATAWVEEDMVDVLMHNMRVIPFEIRKDFTLVFGELVKKHEGLLIPHLVEKTDTVVALTDAFKHAECAVAVGPLLRLLVNRVPRLQERFLFAPNREAGEGRTGGEGEAAAGGAGGARSRRVSVEPVDKDQGVATRVAATVTAAQGKIAPQLIQLIVRYVRDSNFEVASGAFSLLSALLTTPRAPKDNVRKAQQLATVTRFLTELGEEFFGLYKTLFLSDLYLPVRQGLQLLGEILLEPNNKSVMMEFVGSRDNLRDIMMQLRSQDEGIRFEAFHIFKIFVANPKKTGAVAEVLLANSTKLVQMLRDFQNERDDDQFVEEKALLIRTLESDGLRPPDDYKPTILSEHALRNKELREAEVKSKRERDLSKAKRIAEQMDIGDSPDMPSAATAAAGESAPADGAATVAEPEEPAAAEASASAAPAVAAE